MMREREQNTKAPEICLIAPSQTLADNVRKLAHERGEEIGIYVGVLDEGLKLAQGLSERGAKVFVSRKGTAALIANAGFNVVKINTTLNDYLRHLHLMKHCQGTMAIVEYTEFVPELKSLCEYLEIEGVEIYGYSNEKEYLRCVEAVLKSNAEIIMGGGAQLPVEAQRQGKPFTVVENTEKSISFALDSAQQLLKVQKEEATHKKHYKIQLEKYETVVNYTHDAVISVDTNGKIAVVNDKALELLGIPENCIGQSIQRFVPQLQFSRLKNSGNKEIDTIVRIKENMLLLNKIPIEVNGVFEGAVYLLKTVKEIQESEGKIRQQLYKRGHVAKYDFEDIIGNSPAIQLAKKVAKTYAGVSSSILISGETGTGKELFAQSIHRNSSRRKQPFVAINCAALPKDLLSSQLFGYEEGAFTGATRGGKAGIFEIAHGGTIFLDEIGEIPHDTQIQLLRVLQEKEVRRLSSDKVIPIDVWVICATNKDLAVEVRENRFRMDLYYRINVLKLSIPPLRERELDIPLIANHFIDQFCHNYPEEIKQYMEQVYPALMSYEWPGNVRELLAVLERITTLLERDPNMDINLSMVMENVTNPHIIIKKPSDVPNSRISEVEIRAALLANSFQKGKAAKDLGISRSTLWRLMSQYDLK